MDDLISRQAAIDALKKHEIELPIYTPRETDVFWDDAIDCCISEIEALPSAQPDIIVCADCKHHSHDAGYGRDWCNRMSGVFRVKPDDYCSRAERRTDD